MKRRSFLKGLLATATIPLISKASANSELAKQMLEARKIMDAAPVPIGYWNKSAFKAMSDDFKEGDIFTMEGVTKSDGSLQQFKVTSGIAAEVARNESAIIPI